MCRSPRWAWMYFSDSICTFADFLLIMLDRIFYFLLCFLIDFISHSEFEVEMSTRLLNRRIPWKTRTFSLVLVILVSFLERSKLDTTVSLVLMLHNTRKLFQCKTGIILQITIKVSCKFGLPPLPFSCRCSCVWVSQLIPSVWIPVQWSTGSSCLLSESAWASCPSS